MQKPDKDDYKKFFDDFSDLASKLVSIDFDKITNQKLEAINSEISRFFKIADFFNETNAGIDIDRINSIISVVNSSLRNKTRKTKLLYQSDKRRIGYSAATIYKAPKNQNPPSTTSEDDETKSVSALLMEIQNRDAGYSGYLTRYLGALSQEEGSKKAREIINFIRDIGPVAAREYFYAIDLTKSAQELTREDVLEFVREIGPDAAWEYFSAIGSTNSVKELTNEWVLEFAREIGPDAARKYFYAIDSTKSVQELTSEDVLEFAREIGPDAACEYFSAIGSTNLVKKLTDKRLFNSAAFIREIGPEAARKYFFAIGSTNSVKELTDSSFLSWLKNQHKLSDLTALAEILKYTHNIHVHHSKDDWSFDKDPFGSIINGKSGNELIAEIKIMKKTINELNLLKESFGEIDYNKLKNLVKTAKRLGNSMIYPGIAISFVKTAEDYNSVFSGDRSKINKIIVQGFKDKFNVTIPLEYFDDFLEKIGGFPTLADILENEGFFEGKDYLINFDLQSFIKEKRKKDFEYIKSQILNFNPEKPYVKSYFLKTGKENQKIKEGEREKIFNECRFIIDSLFPKTDTSEEELLNSMGKSMLQFLSAAKNSNLGSGIYYLISGQINKDEVKSLSNEYAEAKDEKVKSSITEKLVNHLNSIWYNFDSLKRFAYGLTALEKNLRSIKSSDANRYNELNFYYNNLLNSIEERFAQEYFKEYHSYFEDIKDEASALEALEAAYQYIYDPNLHVVLSPGREMLFNMISNDSKLLEKAIPNEGIITFKSWNRSVSDIFGGRYSGDCTAPPNTGEYSGSNFWANFGWIEDAGTSILNIYYAHNSGEEGTPVGRAYLFATKIDGKPAVFIDSVEFLASFPAGDGVEKALVDALKDFANYVKMPVYIDIKGVSNRGWVNDTIKDANFPIQNIKKFEKLGAKPVKFPNESNKLGEGGAYMEHSDSEKLYCISFS